MDSFSLVKQPALALGAGVSREVGTHVSETVGENARVLMVCDPALKALGLVDPVADAIRNAGHDLEVFDDLQSDPREASVDAATAQAHAMKSNCIVGLGGGSALDTSKLVAVLADSGSACAPYRLSAEPLPFRKTGLICIPTTAGTGAETSQASIVSQADGRKNWFYGLSLKSDLGLLDPELTTGLPPFWTFFTGMDALVHSIESRTNRYRFDRNDPHAEQGIACAIANLERAVLDPQNLEARAGMLMAAAYGGLAIGNTGCAVAHNIGHALGSIAGVPHGRAVSVALLATLDWAIEGNREAFDRVGVLLGGQSAHDIAPILHRLAESCGFDLVLDEHEKAQVSAEVLAKDMVDPANISMIEATARDAGPKDIQALAELTLAA